MAISINDLLDTLTGIDATDLGIIETEIASTEKRLELLKKLQAMVLPLGIKPGVDNMLKCIHNRRSKGGGNEADRKPRRMSKAPCNLHGDSLDLTGNLLTPEERRHMMAKLIDKQGAMTPGALAASIKCDVARIYGDCNNSPSNAWFGKSPDGVTLTPKGREMFGL